MSPEISDSLYQKFFCEIPWKNDEAIIFGKKIITARKVAWYGDTSFSYVYSGISKQALRWSPELTHLKSIVEKHSGSHFNSCLLNLYHDGNEGMTWHSDDEKTLVKESSIASVSLGAERDFRLKHKQKDYKVSVLLEHGSLLVMKGATQDYWVHSVPKSKKVKMPRINLTFRSMVHQEGKNHNL